MKNTSTNKDYDVIVIGAGLGGLSAGLHLQQQGFRVALLERLNRVGGLCGTCLHEGHEFVIACNDFGLAMEKTLGALGVPVRFRKYRTRIFHAGLNYTLPPNAATIIRLLLHALDLRRYMVRLNKAKNNHYADDRQLEELVDRAVKHPRMRDLLKLPAYLMGVAPHQFRVDSLHDEFEFKYGYWQPTAPDGGPQIMAQAMADKFLEQGDILLETEFLSSTPDESGKKKIHTNRGDLHCRYLVNTTARMDYYPENFARGLPISMYWLVLDKKFHYPSGVHTSIYYPQNISNWFSMLGNGQLPEQFGFHVFKSDLPEKTDHYTVNLYFYLPRGCESPDAQVLKQVESFLFPALEKMLPGIGSAIRARYFVSPDDFKRRHALSSRVLPIITPCSYPKPQNYCAEQDIYYAGAAYFPPGDHASAAVLSGAMVAKLIGQTQARTSIVE